MNAFASSFLDELETTDIHLLLAILFLSALACIQHYLALTRTSPRVPLKHLPPRPALQILFKPDDDLPVDDGAFGVAAAASASAFEDGDGISVFSEDASWADASRTRKLDSQSATSASRTQRTYPSSTRRTRRETKTTTSSKHHELPDSFAPLLSSSEMQLLTHNLTADLLHACHVHATVQLQEGRHSIPLNKNELRPQFWLESTRRENQDKGCQISASVVIGSQNLTMDQDLDTKTLTPERSRPMVKNVELMFDPPLKLGNVAPTLLHFPTLFEDLMWIPILRGSVFGYVLDFMSSLWYLVEKVLWWIERRCQVHLGKVKAMPIYRCGGVEDAHWRLGLAFSGYVLLFDRIPIPFLSVRLPTFIIPQPHALVEKLLTAQPLASARLKRENIAEEKIVIAVLNSLETWSTNVKMVGTPPALGVDLTMPGGITVAVEMMHGRENSNQHYGKRQSTGANNIPREISNETLSTWQTPYTPNNDGGARSKTSLTGRTSPHPHLDSVRSRGVAGIGSASQIPAKMFDANAIVPWYFEASANGSIGKDKLVLNIPVCKARHVDDESIVPSKSILALTGSVVICRAQSAATVSDRRPAPTRPTMHKRTLSSNSHLAALNAQNDAPPIHAMMLFPDTYAPATKRTSNHLLEYDYEFDVGEESHLDAISLSYGASHPMLKGGTLISCMLESIYAYGSIFAREGAIADPSEKLRKRNILRHLPAVEFTAGVENFYLPKQSVSYFDDGNTRSIPEIDGGRLMIRVTGGIDEKMIGESSPVREIDPDTVEEGIKLIADFGVSTFASTSETNVTEFPELDVFEGSKLCSFVLGTFDGSVTCHLRPQSVSNNTSSTTGPNVFNPLEAYEIDFSGSSVSLRLKESSFNLGHRRIIVPTESTFAVKILQSVVNMSFEGTTQCELSWDFQGSSPILQVTAPGQTLAQSTHENRQQAPLLINDLCQGRLNLDVSSVGGICFTRASTSREDKQGLYDWKFFNALVSPDEDSPTRIRDVLYDKKTMHQLLAVIKLLNSDMEKILRYVLTQIWRAKSIFDEEGISDPGHALPSYRLARLASLFLCGDVSEVNNILPIIKRVVAADGLDVVGVKELLRKHVEAYDEWAAEIDRGVKWAAAALGPMPTAQPFVETDAPPLCETIPEHVYHGVPTAKMLYDVLQDKPNLPLDINTSKLVGRIAPYLTFRQISYVLHSRPSNHWQPFDLKRLRYVYTIKKKVMEVSESYGGLSFMPQSFFLSVFLGEATRGSLRAPVDENQGEHEHKDSDRNPSIIDKRTVLSKLRRRRMEESFRVSDDDNELFIMSPAGRIASMTNFSSLQQAVSMSPAVNESPVIDDLLGDSLLGPQDVAVLLQAGLTSAMKGSTVVQLNQRMLLDLMASQPRSFATAVLAELGIGNSRALTSALMSFVEMDQSSFKLAHRINMHHLLESWLPGIKIPKREDYLAGGRWARQSYYDAMFHVAVSILDLAETYIGLKLRLQRVRHQKEKDPLPAPKQHTINGNNEDFDDKPTSKLMTSIKIAKELIAKADDLGNKAVESMRSTGKSTKDCILCKDATAAYKAAFVACSQVRSMDKLAFQADWFKQFYRRNYDALMVNSIYENVINDVDRVRIWMEALRCGSKGVRATVPESVAVMPDDFDSAMSRILSPVPMSPPTSPRVGSAGVTGKPFFTAPEKQREQDLVDAIIDAIFYDPAERDVIMHDPLVRLLISNDPGHYNFTLITAMGVITEGKKGMELQRAIERLEKTRGVVTIRSDTGTARSFDYNASKIEEAAESARQLNRPFGIVGYSQGCANEIHFESMMLSGTPDQQKIITSPVCGMVCRQLLFSAANGSIHGPAGEAKVHKLITMSEDFFKYQQGYFSRAFISSTLEIVNGLLDSSGFHKFMGGMQGFFPEYLRAFWREAQHLPHIPTCVLRGVLESHTTPESLDMLSNQLSKQSGSTLHDSQVHVYDAVGHPIYVRNRNMRILKAADMGGAIQRTHHWSPLSEEVEYVKTNRDVIQASFDCAKDRHIFPFVDVNARFGIIKYVGEDDNKDADDTVQFGLPTLSTPLPPRKKL